MALAFLLPSTPIQPGQKIIRMYFPLDVRTGWPAVVLTTLFLTFVDVIIDPVALLGDRWFLGKIYFYPDPGIHFGVPLANYLGWATVSLLALMAYLPLDRKLTQKSIPSSGTVTGYVLLGCGLYYGVLIFNLGVTFWIEEPLQGMTGIMIYIPITILLILRLLGRLPAPTQELQK
jgi:putative membrane protein